MSITKSLFVPVLLASIAFAACDQSKAELESTKQQLQTVSMERDNLKAQLDASKQQTAALAKQINDVQAKLTAAMAALAAPPEAGKGDKKGGAGGKTGSPKPSESPKAPAP
jgi:septal ring factor EnvC (AmiA/AmiB activator)